MRYIVFFVFLLVGAVPAYAFTEDGSEGAGGYMDTQVNCPASTNPVERGVNAQDIVATLTPVIKSTPQQKKQRSSYQDAVQ